MTSSPSDVVSVDGSNDILSFVPFFKVIVCKACGFAIQPNAIPRHMKERHKFYRHNRRLLLEQITRLSLASPADVAYPKAPSPRVPHLPVFEGYSCSHGDCDFLCLSSKRMKHHWVGAHGQPCAEENLDGVNVQTLFRGNCVRYFAVLRRDRSSSPEDHRSTSISPRQSSHSITAGLPSRKKSLTPPPSSEMSSHPDLSMSDLHLLYHYLSTTIPTLIHHGPLAYFTHTLPQLALHNRFLMQNLLSVSALHLAISVGSEHVDSKQYVQLATLHQSRSLPGYRSALAAANGKNLDVIIAYSKLLMMIKCANVRLLYSNPSETSQGGSTDGEETPVWNSIIEYLKLTRGNTHMVLSMLNAHDDGQFSWLFPMHPLQFSPLPPSHAALTDLHEAILNCDEPSEVKDVLVHSFGVLSKSFTTAYSPSKPSLHSALMVWTAGISSQFLDLVEKMHTYALAILAYFCVVLKSVRQSWWMTNHDKVVLSGLYRASPHLKPLIEWPLEQVEV